eukprot:Tbor_TRINITY_DN5534_c1_g1::TRINITY_DN5534_c1_g1_i1::g.12594::m.12594
MNRARNIINPSLSTKSVISGQPAPNCSVIGESELNHLYDIVSSKKQQDLDLLADHRENLRQMSNKRVAKWPNTIDAQRLRKEEAQRERLAQEDERRRLIDEEEDALRDAAKQCILDKAIRHQYEQNDKVKSFTSKLFLASVLEDREHQIATNKEKLALQLEEEKKWQYVESQLGKKADEIELRKLAMLKEKSLTLRSIQQQQIEEIRERKIAERDANIVEGKKIKVAVQEALLEENESLAKRREQQREINKQLSKTNLENRNHRELCRLQELAEDAKIEEFAHVKESQTQERKMRLQERHDAKLKRRQEIIDAQSERLAKIQANVEEREMKAKRDFDRERDERERRERELRNRREKEINAFYTMQCGILDEQRRKKTMENERMKEVWKQRSEILIDEELNDRKVERDRADRLQKFHLLQMQEKKQQSLLEKRREIDEGIFIQDALKNEQDMYENYVNAVMGDYVKNGHPTSVIKKAVTMKKVF